jgi:hypothetical protein
MLLAFLLIQATSPIIVHPPPIAVDVTGMSPQIAFVRQTAAARGWRITCEGRSGEEQVLRLDPGGDSSEAIDAALDNRISGSRYYYPAGERPGPTCDMQPTITSGGRRSALAIGTEAQLAPLLEIARACGFTHARTRQMRLGDLPAAIAQGVSADALVLSADEDISSRYGPGICFLQMQHPPGANLPRRTTASSRPALP